MSGLREIREKILVNIKEVAGKNKEEIKEEVLLDVLVKDYWSKDAKSKTAFDKYLAIITLMKISEGVSPRQIQQILLYQLLELNEISGVGKEW